MRSESKLIAQSGASKIPENFTHTFFSSTAITLFSQNAGEKHEPEISAVRVSEKDSSLFLITGENSSLHSQETARTGNVPPRTIAAARYACPLSFRQTDLPEERNGRCCAKSEQGKIGRAAEAASPEFL